MTFAKRLFFVALFVILLMESGGSVHDPWSGFSSFFHEDIKSWLPASGIIFNPLEIAMIVIFFAWLLRGRRDRRLRFERGLLFWPVTALAGILVFGLLWGAIQPGYNFNIALWEIRAVGYTIIAYFLVGILFTHRRDLSTLTWVVLAAAFLLGVECIIRYYFFLPGHFVSDFDYDHDDATILAFATLLSAAMVLLGCTRRQRWFALASIALDMSALVITHRRAGEAALAIGGVFLAAILFRVDKRLFFKIVPVTAVVLSIYLAAFWDCTTGGLCQPARALTSQINPDPRDESSDEYRYIETQDLIFNIEAQPITGLGFGQKFVFYLPLPDESFWPFWHYTPHNSILWVWVKAGALGFFFFWWLIGSGLYRGGRLIQALNAAGDKQSRALLAAATAYVVMQVTYSYVDLGLMSARDMLLFGVMLGVIGHLPAILRRAANKDEPTGQVKGQAAGSLAIETPEVQVGLLARTLVSPLDTTPTQKQIAGQRSKGSNWGQGEPGVASWRRNSRPVSPEEATDSVFKGSASRRSRWSDDAGESGGRKAGDPYVNQ